MYSPLKKYINISDVASLIGKTNYDFVSPFERLLKKSDSYNNIIKEIADNKHNKLLEIEKIDSLNIELNNDLKNNKITKQEFDSKISYTSETKQKITQDIDNIEDKLLNNNQKLLKVVGSDIMTQLHNTNLSNENKQELLQTKLKNLDIKDNTLIKQGTSIINTNHGTHYENNAIKLFEKKFKVTLDTSQHYYSKSFFKRDYEWHFGGKVDGLYIDKFDTKKSYIVEVKNRIKSFFNTVRDYEKTQIILYMELLNIPRAKLVEHFNSKLRITDMYIDKDYSKDIFKKLELFIVLFEEFLKNHDLQKEFIMKTDFCKRNFIQLNFFNKLNDLPDNTSDQECLL